MRYQFRPLDWSGPATPPAARKRATFRATYPATQGLLWREIAALGAADVILQVDIAERDIRTDGLPRANARYGTNPGVVVSFESTHGPLRYATDAFTEWQDNLRAIALSLEALRAVDRYGVSRRGEQYTGWRAIEAAGPSASRGKLLVREHGGIREALFATHPDRGGSAADFADVQAFRDAP